MATATAALPVRAHRSYRTIWMWYAALVVLMAWGLASWIYELHYGLAATGMRDVVSWGAYIFTFAFFIGLSAGGLIMASSAEVFGIKALKPLSRLGVLSAAACVTVAALMIIPDLGQPFRVINIFIHPNWSSPLIWDILIITVYFVFSVVDLYVLQRHASEPARWHKVLRVLAYLGLPTAVLLHSVTAWIFGLQIARTWWNTSLMAPLFVVSAILSGTALVTLLALCAHRFGKFELAEDTRKWLRGFIIVSLFIDLFFVGADYITVLWGNVPADRSALNLVLPGGPWAWLFWAEWILGGLVPLALLLVPRLRKLPGTLGLASVLVIAGVLAFRIELVVIGFINPLTQFPPGNALGTYNPNASSFQLVGHYHPTWVEYGIVIGLVALFATIVTVGYRRLHVMETIPVAKHRGERVQLRWDEGLMTFDLAVSNGKSSRAERPTAEAVIAAADLLSHFWSRPVASEMEIWSQAGDIEAEAHRLMGSDPLSEPVKVPVSLEESLDLLEDYERLFVGPGQVPCPPYESFWREDVPVDIRRTLMGPCTSELKELYRELGLQVSSRSGELPDHVAVEFEAIAYAVLFEETGTVARRLFEEHLCRFLPRLCRAVSHDAQTEFYRDLAVLTLDWLSGLKAYFAVSDLS